MLFLTDLKTDELYPGMLFKIATSYDLQQAGKVRKTSSWNSYADSFFKDKEFRLNAGIIDRLQRGLSSFRLLDSFTNFNNYSLIGPTADYGDWVFERADIIMIRESEIEQKPVHYLMLITHDTNKTDLDVQILLTSKETEKLEKAKQEILKANETETLPKNITKYLKIVSHTLPVKSKRIKIR